MQAVAVSVVTTTLDNTGYHRIVKEEAFLDNGTLMSAFVPDYLANKLAPMLQAGSSERVS